MEAGSSVSSVSTVHVLPTAPPKNRGFIPRTGQRLFIHFRAARSVLGPTKLPLQWAPEAPSLAAKWPGREANH